MRVLIGIVFWTLATLEISWLLFMLFMSLAAGPRMAENGDLATPLFWNVLLPLAVLIGAILLFARTRIPALRVVALLVVLAPIAWLLTWTEGETIRTQFVDPSVSANGL